MNLAFFHQLTNELAKTPQKAQLLAVTKYSTLEEINEVIRAGVTKIGENRIEVLEGKLPHLLPVEKHFIGTIQSKKLRRIFKAADIIESIGTLEHLENVNQIAQEENKKARIFLQFNISGESQKSGFHPNQAAQISQILEKFPHIQAEGVMAMAENTQNDEEIRAQFKIAKSIFHALKQTIPTIKELSIGMSQDYKIALEEGATLVRIGSALFRP